MQAVILAGGRGTRMGDLTESLPKPLLKIGEKTLLERTLDALPQEITEVIIVVHYFSDVIQKTIGNRYGSRTITYVQQTKLLGTGQALREAKDILRGTFIVLMADDIYDLADIAQACMYPWSITVQKMPWQKKKASILQNTQKNMQGISQEISEGNEIFVNTGLYTLGMEFFEYPLEKLPENGEYSLPHTLAVIAKYIPVRVLETQNWRQINTKEEFLQAVHSLDSRDIL